MQGTWGLNRKTSPVFGKSLQFWNFSLQRQSERIPEWYIGQWVKRLNQVWRALLMEKNLMTAKSSQELICKRLHLWTRRDLALCLLLGNLRFCFSPHLLPLLRSERVTSKSCIFLKRRYKTSVQRCVFWSWQQSFQNYLFWHALLVGKQFSRTDAESEQKGNVKKKKSWSICKIKTEQMSSELLPSHP